MEFINGFCERDSEKIKVKAGPGQLEKLILIRHAESSNSVQGLTDGWTDSGLTDFGKKQAKLTSRWLRNFLRNVPFQFYCSDLKRAKETAGIIGKLIDQSLTPHQALRELNNGTAANKTKEEAESLYLPPTEPRMDWIAYPEGESWRMMYKRVSDFMNYINDDDSETALIVSHHSTIVCIIHWWLELPEELLSKVYYDIDSCSISQLRINSWGVKTITTLNDTGHMAKLKE